MRRLHICYLIIASPLLAASQPQTEYITDLEAITSLAPCASSGVATIVQQLTNSQCLTAPTDLASCACTNATFSASVASNIRTEALQFCGTTASEDVNSALTVFSLYFLGGISMTLLRSRL